VTGQTLYNKEARTMALAIVECIESGALKKHDLFNVIDESSPAEECRFSMMDDYFTPRKSAMAG